jgi:hypothetical protein
LEHFEFLSNFFNDDKERRFLNDVARLRKERIHPIIKIEVDNIMKKLQVKFGGRDEKMRTARKLFQENGMMGECWEMSNFLSPFFKDDDCIVRGSLNGNYEHGWIEFRRYVTDYICDAALSIICKKDDYYEAFNPEIVSKIPAKLVKQKLLTRWNDREANSVHILGGNNPEAPIYRGSYDLRLRTFQGKISGIQLYTHMNA